MLTRNDLISPNRQDKNAGNSGDLVKHISYLALIRELHYPDLGVIEAHGGKAVYVATHRHLVSARHNTAYSQSTLGSAQADCFASVPSGLGTVADIQSGEMAYAGSAALHASVARGRARSLTVFDSDAGVRSTVARVFSQPCFAAVRPLGSVEENWPRHRCSSLGALTERRLLKTSLGLAT
jgi:hypothetical protein